MANNNHVASRTAAGFGNFKIAEARGVSIAATGNALVTMPILDGGLTNSGANLTSGVAIVRRVTIANYGAGNINTANVSVGWTNDGGNLVANLQTLTTMTANNMYYDLTLSGTANTTMVNGNVSSVLFFNLSAGNVAAATVDVSIYGDIVKP